MNISLIKPTSTRQLFTSRPERDSEMGSTRQLFSSRPERDFFKTTFNNIIKTQTHTPAIALIVGRKAVCGREMDFHGL